MAATAVTWLALACVPKDDLSDYSRPVAAAGAGGVRTGDGEAPDTAPEDAGTTLAPGSSRPDAAAGAAGAGPGGSDAARDAGGAGGAADAGSLGDASAALSCGTAETAGPDGTCYALVPTLLSWTDARESCQARGAGWDLAAVDGSAVNDFIGALLPFQAWMGASDLDAEGTWTWLIGGSAFWSGSGAAGAALNGAYTNWNGVEPNGGENSDCLRLVPNNGDPTLRTWADLECAELLGSLCQGPPS